MFTVVYRKGFGYGLIKVIESISCQPLVRFFIILKSWFVAHLPTAVGAISFPQRLGSSSQKQRFTKSC